MEWYIYPLVVFAGVLAGFINTLAGSGSAITLGVLLFLGLPADMANGTNRVGVVALGLGSMAALDKKLVRGLLKKGRYIVVTTFIGALVGALVVVEINEAALEKVIGGLMIVLLFVVLFNPKRWLQDSAQALTRPTLLHVLLFFAIGFYGGFIQMGFGIFFLAAAVLWARYSLIDSNIIKILVTFLFAIPVLGIFIWHGDVQWGLGLTLAVGQAIGGWLAARYALGHPQANAWIRRLLIVMIVAVIVKIFVL